MKNTLSHINLSNYQLFKEILVTASAPQKNSKPKIVTFLNPFSYYRVLDQPELINEIDYYFSDGSLLTFLHNVFDTESIERVSFDFSSVAHDVFQSAQENGLTLALVGSTKEEMTIASQRITKRYPKLSIIFSKDGFFETDSEIKECLNELLVIRPDILICGMGAPLQESFLVQARKQGVNSRLMFTCGGFFSQTAIREDYYFPIIRRFGLRWLQRLIEHQHIRSRVVRDYPVFLLRYLKEKRR